MNRRGFLSLVSMAAVASAFKVRLPFSFYSAPAEVPNFDVQVLRGPSLATSAYADYVNLSELLPVLAQCAENTELMQRLNVMNLAFDTDELTRMTSETLGVTWDDLHRHDERREAEAWRPRAYEHR